MPAITLAKALKLKNRLAGRLNKTQEDIRLYNSVLEEQKGQVDVPALAKLRDELSEALIALKTGIILANKEIQNDLIRQGELKAKLTFIATIPVREGKLRHDFQNTDILYVAAIKKADIDKETKTLEAQIDAIQDKVDTYNHTQKLEVPARTLDLAS
jgi:hypothetical protein